MPGLRRTAVAAALGLAVLAAPADAFTIAPTSFTATVRGQTFRSTTGINTSCNQRFTITVTVPTIVLPVVPGTVIGYASNQSFTLCTSVGIAPEGTWDVRLDSFTLSSGSVTSISIIIAIDVLAGGICRYRSDVSAGEVSEWITTGASAMQQLTPGLFVGSGLCGTASTSPATYGLSSAVTIR